MFPGGGFPHGFTFEFDTIGVVDQPVKNRVRERRIPDDLMPVFDRKLAGNNGGGPLVPVFEYFKDISALGIIQGGKPPVVDDQHMGSGQGPHQF